MKIASVEVFPVRLPLKAVLTLPRGPSRTLDEGKRIALVKMTDSACSSNESANGLTVSARLFAPAANVAFDPHQRTLFVKIW